MKITLIAAGVSVLSVFLPWLEATVTSSSGGQSMSMSSGGFAGTEFDGAILGLIVAIAGGVMVYKQIKYAFAAGAINLIIGLGHALGIFGEIQGGSYKSAYVSANTSVSPKIGLIIFLICTIIFMVNTYNDFKPVIKSLKDAQAGAMPKE